MTFRPVHYDAARKVLRVSRQVRVRIDFAGQDLTNALTRTSDFIPESFDRLYRALVVNYDAPAAPPGDGAKSSGTQVGLGTWLVICPNDAAVTSRLQPLVDWRQREGYTVKLATTAETGTTTTQIKAYIQNAYNTWRRRWSTSSSPGTPTAPTRIPTWYESLSGYGGEGDHPYTQLAGGDILADVHLGRLSFSTLTELEVIVAKTVSYESDPLHRHDPAWFTRACLVGDPDASGYSTRPGPAVDQDPPAPDRLHPDRHRLRRELRQPDDDGAEPRRHHLLLPRLLRHERLEELATPTP